MREAGLRRRTPFCCDLCGERICPEEDWYDMPDGLRVCADRHCLEDWAGAYLRRRPACEEDDEA